MAIALPRFDRRYRNRRYRKVGSRIISAQKLTQKLLEQSRGDLTDDDLQLLEDHRPRQRADCADNGLRPCPFVSCRHHLFLDVSPQTGALVMNFPDLEPWQLEHSCSLDLADGQEDGFTLEACGVLLNLTRERVRQIEGEAMGQLQARAPQLPRPTVDDHDDERRGVRPMANLKIMRSKTEARAIVVRAPTKPPRSPCITYTCGSCGKRERVWFDGYEPEWLVMLSTLVCMAPSHCCDAPVTAKLEGLPRKAHRGEMTKERIRTDIIEALRRACERGMSWRQLRRRVRGGTASKRIVLRELALSGSAPVVARATGSYMRYFFNGSGTSGPGTAKEDDGE